MLQVCMCFSLSTSGAVIRKSPIENTKNPIDIVVILQSGSK